MDVLDFDIEEMDVYEREELEAMLYAQLHHVDPLPPEPPAKDPIAAKISQLNTATTKPETHSSVTRGHGHSSPKSVRSEEGDAVQTKSETAVDVCIPAVENTSATTPGSMKPDANVTPAVETDNQPLVEANDSGVPDQTKHPASSSSGTPSTIPQSPTQCPPTNVGTPLMTSNSQPPQDSAPTPSAAQLSRMPKRPLPPVLSDDEPETKTAALEADKRRRRRRQQPNEPITVHDTSSGSSTDEYVLEAGDDPPAAPAPASTTSGVSPSSAASPSGIMSPEVVTIDKSSPTAPEVISLDGDSQPSSPKPSTSSASAGTAANGAERTRQKLSAASRRARSLGGAETLRRRRPRPSSDLSSSDDSDGGGAAPADDCDIRMNVRGAGQAAAGRTDRALADQTAGARSSLPLPAWRCAMADTRLTEAELRQLEPLCRSQPCHKWSHRQRAGYTTPKDYGPQDVGSIQATMADEGWDIPAEYLTRSAGGRTPKSRYYSSLTRNRCRRCDEVGHLVADCPLPPTCYLCGDEGHSGDGRCPNMICFTCGGRSHPTERCPVTSGRFSAPSAWRRATPLNSARTGGDASTPRRRRDRWSSRRARWKTDRPAVSTAGSAAAGDTTDTTAATSGTPARPPCRSRSSPIRRRPAPAATSPASWPLPRKWTPCSRQNAAAGWSATRAPA